MNFEYFLLNLFFLRKIFCKKTCKQELKKLKIKNQIETNLCYYIPNAFWSRKQHKVSLPYVDGFDENQIPIKERPIQMNVQLLEYCKQEIKYLLDKNLIIKSHSPWSCVAFYVQKPSDAFIMFQFSQNLIWSPDIGKFNFSFFSILLPF